MPASGPLREREGSRFIDPLLVIDGAAPGWPVLGATPPLAALTGWSAQELTGRTWPPLWDPEAEAAKLEGLAEGVRTNASAAARLATLRRAAEPLPTVVRVAPLGSGGLTACSVLALGDAELSRLAFTDPATGLANRRALDRDLEAAVSRADRNGCSVAVLYVDLDRFKAVNDEFGHHAGDRVLREVASRLRVAVRGHDLVARVGGDEFIVALTDIQAPARERAMAVAQHLEAALAAPVDDRIGSVGASIGVALHPDDAASSEELLVSADEAMYRRKRMGRPRAGPAGRASVLERAREAQLVAAGLRDTMRGLRETTVALHSSLREASDQRQRGTR